MKRTLSKSYITGTKTEIAPDKLVVNLANFTAE